MLDQRHEACKFFKNGRIACLYKGVKHAISQRREELHACPET